MSLMELYKLDLEVYLNLEPMMKRNYLRKVIRENDPFVIDLVAKAVNKWTPEVNKELDSSEYSPRIVNLREQRELDIKNIKKEIDKCYLKLIAEIGLVKKELPM
jgi:hypothetical protein